MKCLDSTCSRLGFPLHPVGRGVELLDSAHLLVQILVVKVWTFGGCSLRRLHVLDGAAVFRLNDAGALECFGGASIRGRMLGHVDLCVDVEPSVIAVCVVGGVLAPRWAPN